MHFNFYHFLLLHNKFETFLKSSQKIIIIARIFDHFTINLGAKWFSDYSKGLN